MTNTAINFGNLVANSVFEVLSESVNENYATEACKKYENLSKSESIFRAAIQLDETNFNKLLKLLEFNSSDNEVKYIQAVLTKVHQSI